MRVRFAPSPTGNLHIGTLRTALFNWLYARANKGTFVLRIEDTDLSRSESRYEDSIVAGLSWLGLECDESPQKGGPKGPYRQSERIAQGIYRDYANRLVASGDVYPCFCTPDDLEAEREAAKEKGIPYAYSRRCLNLTEQEKQTLIAERSDYTFRFKMPDDGILSYTDLIRGEISFDLSLISDFVVLKSDGTPSYNFAVVVDDIMMDISHVIRGEDHIPNMPKQLCLFKAFSATLPQFAHMPMILGPDKSKLSKRHGATNVIEYKQEGFLPEALFNFLSLLGWSPDSEQEIFTREELVSLFGLERVSKSGAVFDSVKLKWMNGQYIRALSSENLFKTVYPFLTDESAAILGAYSEEKQKAIVEAVRDNLTLSSDINLVLTSFMSDAAVLEKLKAIPFQEEAKRVIQLFLDFVLPLDILTEADVEHAFNSIFTETQLGKGKVYKPIRLAVTGEGAGPHIPTILEIVGKGSVVKRLQAALAV